MNLPSKELLSEVLGCNVENFKTTHTPSNDIGYYALGSSFSINIYELAHKCKEWAIKQGFSITSTNSYMGDLQPTAQPVSSHGCEYPWIDGTTESEAIFKACQWVLDNKEIR